METRTELFAFFGIAVFLFISSIGFYFSKSVQTNPPLDSLTSLEECNPLIYNGESASNIVFFSEEAEAAKYANYLLETSPFRENKENFNFFYITPESHAPRCKTHQGVAVLCYYPSLIRAAASCPNDYIVVLSDQPEEIRSSSYLNVMSLNTAHPLSVFNHEFGHSFGYLAEEYVPARIPKRSQNCKDSCSAFNGQAQGCYQGCSDESYFRSIENGVMRTLSTASYGSYNEGLIISVMNDLKSRKSITGAAITGETECSDQKYFLITVESTQDSLEITDTSIYSGCASGYDSQGSDFEYALYNEEEIIIHGEIGTDLFTDYQQEGEEAISGEIFIAEQLILTLPYSNGASSVIIKDTETGRESQAQLQNEGDSLACHL